MSGDATGGYLPSGAFDGVIEHPAPFVIPEAAYAHATAQATAGALYGETWKPVGYTTTPSTAMGVLTDVTEDAPTQRPVSLTIDVDLTPLREAFRRFLEQLDAMRPWIDLLAERLRTERPIDRARRQRVARAMRTRQRRAARRTRRAARMSA